MNNRDVEHAWAYHNGTKHSAQSIRAPFYLDWENQPLPFKIYPTLDPMPLPRDMTPGGTRALSAISETIAPNVRERIPALNDLSRTLYFSAGITKKKEYSGGEIYFRAASCTGALYEFELYLVCGALPDLKAGLYHFSPGDFALRLLRKGDFRGVAASATANEPAVVHAPVTIICAGTYWRNAWKYRTRTYRHFGWDNGTMLANMLAVAVALDFPAKAVCGFVDSELNALIGADAQREVAFSLVPVGHTAAPPPEAVKDLPKLQLPTAPLSKEEVDYPELRWIHEASSLAAPQEVAAWRRAPGQAGSFLSGRESGEGALGAQPADYLESTILRRGSSRRFRRETITLDQFSTMLYASTRGVAADFLEPYGTQLNDVYLIVNAVDGLQPGAYIYHRDTGAFECLKEGQFRAEARYLGLQQDLPGDASAAVFLLADLNPILSRFGNRGYRAVQLEAGIIGGRLYLAAYALRLGATGLTFFDDDVTSFFSPHAAGKSAIFLVALGKGYVS